MRFMASCLWKAPRTFIRDLLWSGLLLLSIVSSVGAQDELSSEPVDRLPLAALLIGDGNYDRARQVLAGVDQLAPDFDGARFHTLSGLVALNLKEYALASTEFRRAIDAGQTSSVVYLYLAQAYFGQADYESTLIALDEAGEATTEIPSAYLIRSQALWQLNRWNDAWLVLNQGRLRFPDRLADFARRQTFLLIETGLYQSAVAEALHLVALSDGEIGDLLAVGNALLKANRATEAMILLEDAMIRAPNDATVARLLAQAYLSQNMTLAAAEVLRRGSYYQQDLLIEAAELFRLSGQLTQALLLNGQAIDQPKKLKQRLAILIGLGRYAQAASMLPDLTRVQLLDEEEIRYALAYSLFKTGDFEGARAQLFYLETAENFRKATELRRVMAECEDQRWLCL
jgi:tetratricopeptide (TPR) repeat protein